MYIDITYGNYGISQYYDVTRSKHLRETVIPQRSAVDYTKGPSCNLQRNETTVSGSMISFSFPFFFMASEKGPVVRWPHKGQLVLRELSLSSSLPRYRAYQAVMGWLDNQDQMEDLYVF